MYHLQLFPIYPAMMQFHLISEFWLNSGTDFHHADNRPLRA